MILAIRIDSPKEFEFPAEMVAYPVILGVAERLGYSLEYQREFWDWDYRDWVHKRYPNSLPRWVTEHKCEDYPGDDVDCIVCYTYQKYRVDFYLYGYGWRIAIEVDGREFHKNKARDEEKDSYLRRQGISVIRIPASNIFWHPDEVRARLSSILGVPFSQDAPSPARVTPEQ